MRYKNAKDVLPKDVLALIQLYTDGEYIYIPRKTEKRKLWGENTNSKTETQTRNEKIYSQYKLGQKAKDLALEHFLSEKSIQRIITQGNKEISVRHCERSEAIQRH